MNANLMGNACRLVPAFVLTRRGLTAAAGQCIAGRKSPHVVSKAEIVCDTLARTAHRRYAARGLTVVNRPQEPMIDNEHRGQDRVIA